MGRTAELIQHLEFAIRHGTPMPASFLRAVKDELARLSEAEDSHAAEAKPVRVAVLEETRP